MKAAEHTTVTKEQKGTFTRYSVAVSIGRGCIKINCAYHIRNQSNRSLADSFAAIKLQAILSDWLCDSLEINDTNCNTKKPPCALNFRMLDMYFWIFKNDPARKYHGQ